MDFQLYSYFRSSASHRVRIALNLKKVDFEYRPVHLLNEGGEQHKNAYAALNPSREVPTLIHNGKAIGQSMAIIEYLERVQPEPRLFPVDPHKRALITQACEIVNSGIQPLVNLRVLNELEKSFGADQSKKNAWAAGWIKYGLEALETFLKPHAGRYSFGDEITAADCFLIPQLATADRFHVPIAPFATLAKVRSACEGLDAFQKAAPANQPDTPRAT